MKTFFLISFLALNNPAFAVSLLQETRDIICQSPSMTLIIDKRDRFFENADHLYEQVEFLDSAILGTAKSKQSALIQMTQKNSALLVEGQLYEFEESHCKQFEDHKVCKKNNFTLEWAPTYLKFNKTLFSLKHYGVYPNDGTYFSGLNKNSLGITLIDFGNHILFIVGKSTELACRY